MISEYFKTSSQTIRPQYNQIVRELQALDSYITFRDTGETHVFDYEKGTYLDHAHAESVIESRLQTMLGEQFCKRIADEVKYQLKVSTYEEREDFEPPENLVLVKNGILDVYTRELKPFIPTLYFEKTLDAEYNPEARGEYWTKFLADLVCPKLRELQKFCGYLLMNTARYKKGLLQIGDTDTGKSTFGAGIRGVIGESNISGVAIQDLDKRFRKTRLYKKTLNFVGDLKSTAFSHVEVFNMTTGGDFVEGEIKTSNKTLRFSWTGKHWFIGNKLPNVGGDADCDAFYNRLCIVNFPKKIPKDKIIRDFDEKLQAEEEKSAILNWMLDGINLLLEEGFEDTDIEAIRDYYKRSADSIYCFTEDVCVLEPDSYVVRVEAYNAYADYCILKGLPSMGRNTFYDKLPSYIPGVSVDRDSKAYRFKNLKILHQEDQPVEKGVQKTLVEEVKEENSVNNVNFSAISRDMESNSIEGIQEKYLHNLHSSHDGIPLEHQTHVKAILSYLRNNGGRALQTDLFRELRDHGCDFETFKRYKQLYPNLFGESSDNRLFIELREASK